MSNTESGAPAAEEATPTQLSLAGDFPAATEEQWEIEVAKVLNRGRPPEKQLTFEQCMKRLTVHTVDGIDVKPMYRRDDVPGPLGYPGVAPFTRGAAVRNGEADAWDVRALHEDSDAAFTRKAVLTDLERGVTSIWLRVGSDAVGPSDVAEVLSDVLLEMAKIEVSSREDQKAAAEALLAVYEASDRPKDHVFFNLGIDPTGLAAQINAAIRPSQA